jgi:hypothetical protein
MTVPGKEREPADWNQSRSGLFALAFSFSVLLVSSGATCARSRSTIAEFNPPPIFTQGTPQLEELIVQVNRSLSIQSLSSNTLSIDSPDLAYKLGGNFAWERPHNLRLETRLFSSALGTPLAAGSNSEVFWLQTQRPSPTVYYANHDQFEQQLGPRHVLPVSPLWLREAFGIVEMDPNGRHEPPIAQADGKLQVVSWIPSPRGSYRRVLVLAPITGTIEQTMLYNHHGHLVAHARLSDHQYYAAIDWSLPHRVQVQLQPDHGEPLSFEVSVGFYNVNERMRGSTSFEFPDTTGLSRVELVSANASLQRQLETPTPTAPASNGVSALPPIYRSASSGSDGIWPGTRQR